MTLIWMVLDMKKITKVIRDDERAFYGSKNVSFSNVKIIGPQDGESAFKESKNIEVSNSLFCLRYPFWHNKHLSISKCKFKDTARASLWYCDDVLINKVNCKGVKAVRECKNVVIKDSLFESIEFGWQSKNIEIVDSSLNGFYAFLHSKNVKLTNVNFKGKYSFQYVNGLTIENCILDTKDAFWHSKDVVVKDSIVKGEYLAWYSQNIKFINCKIIGTQPICYAKGIVFENCSFEECDLAFEYSEVNGSITGSLISIKNPLKGHIIIDDIPPMIVDDFNKSRGDFVIEKRK